MNLKYLGVMNLGTFETFLSLNPRDDIYIFVLDKQWPVFATLVKGRFGAKNFMTGSESKAAPPDASRLGGEKSPQIHSG